MKIVCYIWSAFRTTALDNYNIYIFNFWEVWESGNICCDYICTL